MRCSVLTAVALCLVVAACARQPLSYEPRPSLSVNKAIEVVQRHIEESPLGSGRKGVLVSRSKIEFYSQKGAPGLFIPGMIAVKNTRIYFLDSIGTMRMYPKGKGKVLVQVYQADSGRGFEIIVATRERAELFLDAMTTLIADAKAHSPTTRGESGEPRTESVSTEMDK